MKLIDVLNMISKGELKEGAIIKYTNFDFILKFSDFELRTYDNDIYFCSCEEFNEEVEIIDHSPDVGKMVKIEELTWYDINTGKGFDSEVLDKLNEVIRELNRRAE